MSTKIENGLYESYDYLRKIINENTKPEDAKLQLSLLKENHPHIEMNLFFQEESYSSSTQYNLLLHEQNEGSLSLSFCSAKDLPWALRGVHRATEQDLVKVNDILLTVGDAIAQIDFVWNEHPWANQLIDKCLILQELQENPVTINDNELQSAMNDFRVMHKLLSAETTHQWMKERGLNHARFETLIQDYASVVKLRNKITFGRVDEYFYQNISDFDYVKFVCVVLKNIQDTQNFLEQVQTQKISFYEALENQFISSKDWVEQKFIGVHRCQNFDFSKDQIFSTPTGNIVQPIKVENGYAIVKILDRIDAQLNHETKNLIQQILFKNWLQQKRRQASIEWYWG